MPSKFVQSVRTGVAVAAMIACAGMSTVLTGCDREDPIDKELRRADVLVSALSTSGSTPIPTSEAQRSELTWIINRLTGRATAGAPRSLAGTDLDDDLPTLTTAPTESDKPSQKAAANLLVSRAQAGLAEMYAREQVEKEAALLNHVAVIRSAVDEWLALNSLAAGLENYDPAPDIARLEAQIPELTADLDAAKAAMAAQTAVIEGLKAKAREAQARATSHREEELGIRSRMSGISQVQKAALLEQATAAKRRSDQADKEASDFLAQVATEEPKAETLEQELSLAEQRLRLANESIAAVRARAESNRTLAATTRQQAQEAAARIEALATEGASLRTNADAPGNEAVRAYEQAVAAANKAVNAALDTGTKAAARLSAGNIQQSMGDVQAARARGLSQLAEVVRSAAEARPPLPDSAAYRQRAEEATTQAAEARAAAVEAYNASINAYDSARSGSGPTAELIQARIKAAKDKLDSIANAFDPTRAARRAAETPEEPEAVDGEATPDGADAAGASDAGGPEAEVRGALRQLLEAGRNRDIQGSIAMLTFEDEADRAFIQSMAGPAASVQALGQAAEAKYGSDLQSLIASSSSPAVQSSPVLGQMSMAMMSSDQMTMGSALEQFKDVGADDFEITMESDSRASVTLEGQGDPRILVKEDGAWKVQMPKMGFSEGPMAAQMNMMATMLAKVAEAADKVTAKINNNEYADADAMLMDLNAQLIGAMGEGAGGMGGGLSPGGG